MKLLYRAIVVAGKIARRLGATLNTYLAKRMFSQFGVDSIVQGSVVFKYPDRISIGENVVLARGVRIVSEIKAGSLQIGNNVKVNKNVILDHVGDLRIREYATISEDAIIYTHSHGLEPRSVPKGYSKTIGRNVWIGTRAIILPQCEEIGDNAIVAAGAVVTKSVPAKCIAYGNPMVIRKLD